jgi:hypothetical protein
VEPGGPMKGSITMRRYLVSFLGGLCTCLLGYGMLWADEVPDALSSAAPALAMINGILVAAWAGDSSTQPHKVWYSSFNGTWTPQAVIPGAFSTSAPALGAAGGHLYAAATPPESNEEIHYYISNGTVFESNGAALCDASTCAHTQASPALAGDGATLYAAWTTPAGAVSYGALSNGVWKIAALPIPNAVTNPTTGPTMTVYHNRLYVAWAAPSGTAVTVVSAPLPLSGNAWSAPIRIPVQTEAAPALGVFTVASPAPTEALFLAWTTPNLNIDFARWDSAAAEWVNSPSPVPLPTGPLTSYTPALTSAISSCPSAAVKLDAEDAAAELAAKEIVGYTNPQHQVNKFQTVHYCP